MRLEAMYRTADPNVKQRQTQSGAWLWYVFLRVTIAVSP